MRALLDTNIVLDSLLARAPWCVDADEILRQAKPGGEAADTRRHTAIPRGQSERSIRTASSQPSRCAGCRDNLLALANRGN